MIAYTFLVVLTLVVAFFEARQDASDIKKHLRIDHAAQLWERARLLGVVVFCTIVGSCWENGAVKWEWRALLFLPICWAVFTVSFRWMLNKARGLDWRYVSPSNVYDYVFTIIAWRIWRLSSTWPSLSTAQKWWVGLYDVNDPASEVVVKVTHRAGTMAYLFELSILALSTWAYVAAQ